MKKVVCVLIALLLCFSLLTPAFAAGDDFVFSISYKDGPSLTTTVIDECEVAAYLIDKNDNVLENVLKHDIPLTSIAAADSSTEIPEASRELLKEMYKKLSDGTESLPYALYSQDAFKNPVIREFFDISLLNAEQKAKLDGGFVDILFTINLGVSASREVQLFAYNGNTWDRAVEIVNNGDGTVSCVLEHLCPIAVVVDGAVAAEPPRTADQGGNMMWIWAGVIALCAAAICVLASKTFKKKAIN